MKPTTIVWVAGAAVSAAWFMVMRSFWGQGLYVPLGLLAGVLVLVAGVVMGRKLVELTRPTVANLLIGVAGGVLSTGLTYALYPLAVAWFPPLEGQVRALYASIASRPSVGLTLILLTIIVIAEEIVWRGVLLQASLPVTRGAPAAGSPRWARIGLGAGAVTLLYAFAQAGSGSLLLFVVALLLGLTWAAMYVWRRSLLAPTLTHLCWSASVLLLWPLET